MTEKAPERIWVCAGCGSPAPFGCDCATGVAYSSGDGMPTQGKWKREVLKELGLPDPEATMLVSEHVAALETAQARIQALEDTLNIERALSDGAHRRAKTARREALEEAVKFILDQPTSDGVVDMAAEELAAAIRALMEGKR